MNHIDIQYADVVVLRNPKDFTERSITIGSFTFSASSILSRIAQKVHQIYPMAAISS